MTGIGIEICYSRSGGDRFIQAEKNAAHFIATILVNRGWGVDRVKKHQDFSGKYCPHRTLDMGWQRFLNMVLSEKMLIENPINEKKPITISHNGINLDVEIVNNSGTTYAPVRKLLESLGYKVTWKDGKIFVD